MSDNKGGRPKRTSTGESFDDIVREISNATQIKPDIVRSILKAWADIFIRNIILYGKFQWHNLFTVRTKVRKEYKGFNVVTGEYETKPAMPILYMSLSSRIKSYWRWKIRNERNAKHGVTAEDWRKWYDNNKESGE
jgi:hypothetical protein